MKLNFYCKECKANNSIRLPVSDRVEMKMKYGGAIEKSCKSCYLSNSYSPNDFEARPSFFPIIITSILLIISLILLKDWIIHFFSDNNEWMDRFPSTYFQIALLLLIPIMVFFLFRYEQEKVVRLFNKSKE